MSSAATHLHELPTRPQSAAFRPFLIAWCICLVVMELLGAGFVWSAVPLDFQMYYTSGYQMRTHPSQLYDLATQKQLQRELTGKRRFSPFDHPSFEALVYVPFSFLKYRTAYFVYIAFNMLLLAAAFVVARAAFSSVIPLLQPRPGLIFFLFLPLLIALIFGQDSILSLLLYCLTWRQLKRGKDASAGSLLALALFKPQIVVPFAAVLVIRRGWKFAGGFLATGAAVTALSICIVGRTGVAALIQLVHGAAGAINKGAAEQQRVLEIPRAMPNLDGLLHACGAYFPGSSAGLSLPVGICSLGLFVWCAFRVRRVEENAAFSVAILCGILVSYHIYIYDLTLALLPIALLTGRVHRSIAIAFFGLAIALVPFGLNWFFLLAVPILGMLVVALVLPPPTTTTAIEV